MVSQISIVTDLGFGASGKGNVVDFLARSAGRSLVVRHNGGPQASSTVICDAGQHSFRNFGAGLFVDDSNFLASKHMLISPEQMDREAAQLLRNHDIAAYERSWIDAEAMVITPWHKLMCQAMEMMRGDAAHGSTGLGVGPAAWAHEIGGPLLRVGDLVAGDDLSDLLVEIRNFVSNELDAGLTLLDENNQRLFSDDEQLAELIGYYAGWGQRVASRVVVDASELLGDVEHVIFQGAQGVLLDQWHGFHPYTTWSDTTPNNALELIDEWELDAPSTSIGLARSYALRHGPGPLPSETTALVFDEPQQPPTRWQGKPRSGWFDPILLEYALGACDGSIDVLGITHLDRVADPWPLVERYVRLMGDDALPQPVDLRSTPNSHHPMVAQQRTRQLGWSTCEMTEVRGGADAFVDAVSQRLELPVWLRSHGPQAEHISTLQLAVGRV